MAKNLSKRGMAVFDCPLGTGVVVEQSFNQDQSLTFHLTPSEALELADALDTAARKVIKSTAPKTIKSLFVQGLRIDQIASELNIPTLEVRSQLILCGLLIG